MSNASALANHTIAMVEMIDIVTRYPRTIGRNAFLGSHGAGPTAGAVIVRTQDGAAGWGLLASRPDNPDEIVGRHVSDLIDPDRGLIDQNALWADFALHDLAGVLTQQPVHQMLGGRGTRQIPVYDGSIYFDDLDPEHRPRGIDAVLENVQAGWDDGHRAFKLKIGRGFTWMPVAEGLERDIAITRAVREAFPQAQLLVDGNNGFTVESFISYLDRVRDIGLFWVEEPFQEKRSDLKKLRNWLDESDTDTLIADGEYKPDVDAVVDLARDGLIDVLLMDVVNYGLTPWRTLLTSLKDTPVRSSPHAWGLPLKTMYAGQMAAGLGGIITVEGVRGETIDTDTSGYTIADGLLTVPDTPGFGMPVPRS